MIVSKNVHNILKPVYNLNQNDLPVFIINYNWLTYTKNLYEACISQNYTPIIIDNGSTYEPLLSWYNTISDSVIFAPNNVEKNHRIFWNMQLDRYLKSDFYAITDSDIDISLMPDDWYSFFATQLAFSPMDITKVGASIKIDDLPEDALAKTKTDNNGGRTSIYDWESKFFKTHFNERFYLAPIDTTLAVYSKSRNTSDFYSALRSKGPYTVRHEPWYLTPDGLSEEHKFFIKSANKLTSNFAEEAINKM